MSLRHDVPNWVIEQQGANARFEAVGRFDFPDGSPQATGTLIDPSWVLTAASVIDGAGPLNFSVGGKSYRAVGWAAPDEWDGVFVRGYDIALVRLDRAVLDVAPMERYTSAHELGAQAAIVGYGSYGNGLAGSFPSSSSIARQGSNTVDAILEDRILITDFDDPDETASIYGRPTPTRHEVAMAPGDGGGPLLVRQGDGWAQAGVASFVNNVSEDRRGEYGNVNGYTRVSLFNAWIDTVTLGRQTLHAMDGAPTFDVPEALAINDGTVAQGDLDIVLLNWGGGAPTTSRETTPTPSGIIGQSELDGVLLNWGNTADPAGPNIPEPVAGLLTLGLVGFMRRRWPC